jgi:hypothetical protein
MLHALSVLAANGVFTLTDRTEIRVRNPDPISNALALDTDTLVDARAVITLPSTLYTIAYIPQLSLLDFNGAGIHPALIHGAQLAADWHSHRTRIVVSEQAAYGDLTFESLQSLPSPASPPTPATPGQPAPLPSPTLVPAAQSVRYAFSKTTVGSTVDLRPWTLTMDVAYQLSGGADSAAEQTLPFEHGPLADASADLKLGARDHLITIATFSQWSFSSGNDDVLAQAEEQWRHHWARMTDTSLGVGAYETHVRPSFTAPYQDDVSAVADAAIDQGFSQGANHEELRLGAAVGPLVNRLTGQVDERVSATAEAIWSRRRVTVRLFGSAAESVQQNTVTAGRYVTGEVDAVYRATDVVTFDMGARALSQLQNTAGAAPGPNEAAPIVGVQFNQVVAFLGVTVHALKTRF